MEFTINHGLKNKYSKMREDLKKIKNTNNSLDKIFPDAQDFLPLLGTDYVEYYVGNAQQAAHFYKTALGFQSSAYAGLETGVTDRTSYVVVQDKIRIVFTTPMPGDNNEIFDHIKKHGDGVKVIALWVDDAKKAWEETTSRGADSYLEPKIEKDNDGEVATSGIKIYGDTVHVFVERKNYNGTFMPGFEKWESHYNPEPVGLKYIDHIVANVGWNEMNIWEKFYNETMGFANLITFDDKDISTQYTALMSKVMTNGNGRVKFPINEPAKGKKKSQIEEYLDFYDGPGVQHIAIATDYIITSVDAMAKRGVEFLKVPSSYYDTVLERVGKIDEEILTLKEHGVLVDRDEEGYLLQIFTKPLTDRPTLFFEIIQRKGAKSFGKGNFKALFECIEAEQARRGTL
jgi:4-hydroxyphenylpyruvate dioxygenase